jgi:hypothetical protein
MFGVDNIGVINQRNAPAIWESALNQFPQNFIKGRILIDNIYGGIYLDTSNSRIQIQSSNSGDLTFTNGLNSSALSPTTTDVNLGGELTKDTDIFQNGSTLTFNGSQTNSVILGSGAIFDQTSEKYYYPMAVESGTPVIPNCIIIFQNPINGEQILVSARQ